MVDIKQCNMEEIESVLKDLKEMGYLDAEKTTGKHFAIRSALIKRGAKNPFVCQDIAGAIYRIADFVLNNEMQKRYSRRTVYLPKDEKTKEEYLKVVDGIIDVIFPYYGKLGFRERS